MASGDKFQLITEPSGYIAKRDITNAPETALVTGSRNCFINDADKVSIRPGYKLFGAAKTKLTKIQGGDTFASSTGKEIPWRSVDGDIEIYVYSAWRKMTGGFSSSTFLFYPWWSNLDRIDFEVGVNGTGNMYHWTGAYTKIASVTANTITKQYYLQDTTIAFNTSPGVNLPATITDSGNRFIIRGFQVGDSIQISGSAGNTKQATILTVAAGTIELALTDSLVTEAAGPSITIAIPNLGLFAEERFRANRTLTATDISFSATKTITRVAGSFITDGWIPGMRFRVSGSASNNNVFTVVSVTTSVLTVNEAVVNEAAGASDTLTEQIPIIINGVTYYYEGGYNTGVLTGVTGNPSTGGVVNGDVMIAQVQTVPNAPAAAFKNDIMNILLNQVYVGSRTSRLVYVSNQSRFWDFTYTTLRKPGEGSLFTLDGYCTTIIPQEKSMYISAAPNFWYQTQFTLSSDNTAETLTIDPLKIGATQASQLHSLTFHTKNEVMFVTFEPTLDTLGRIQQVETPQQLAISDVIKDDFKSYNFTRGHGIYYQNKIYVTLPLSGVVLVYDLDRALWYPPWELPIERFFIYQRKLYAHSSYGNESYEMFNGQNDNGVAIHMVAAFAYRNFGLREKYKQFSRYYVEGYIKANTDVTLKMLYDYKGSENTQEVVIAGDDPRILFSPTQDADLGQNPLGSQPLGSLTDEEDELIKFRILSVSRPINFFEMQAQFECDILDGKFELLAHGPNTALATAIPTTITI